MLRRVLWAGPNLRSILWGDRTCARRPTLMVLPRRPDRVGTLPILKASEIGSFVFCPEAWYLQRHGGRRSVAAEERLAAGTRAHRAIGRQTDHLRGASRVRHLLLAVIVLLIVLLTAQALAAAGLPHP